MGHYLPHTPQERQEMLAAVGCTSMDDLFGELPREVLLKEPLQLPKGQNELGVARTMEKLAAKNKVFPTVFRGAGAYRHYIPAIVGSVTSKEEFLTAYTPYQAEISQGLLQSIFEYQTMVCELTGMEASNASVYDGASAAGEAAAMCRERKRTKTLVSAGAHPHVIDTLNTYCQGANAQLEVVPLKEGKTDLDALKAMLDDSVSGVYLAQPNFYGLLEDTEEAAAIIHEAGAKLILGVNPIAAAILKTPGECGADIAVGEGQPLGMPLSFGGPYLGFMACRQELTRRLPGRIVGETTDVDGRRAYVLTLQAREQHIRREKAGSNVCSNQALCALTAAVYMAAMGSHGMAEAARQCYAKAHYLADGLNQITGFELVYSGEFFHEFVTQSATDSQKLLKALENKGILGGLPLENNRILWCVTELNTREEMDAAIKAAKEVADR